ncbi:hypothetical protein V7P26_09250 [Arcobacter cryaerophilus gv. pseudocryaerophilus]
MARTIFLKTYPRLFLPEFQKRNSWIVTAYSDENDEKSEFYNAYYIYKYYYCSFCGTVEITKKRAKRKDNYYGGHTCQVCKHTEFLNLYCNNEFFKAKNISFELYENEDFYHIQPYTYVPYLNYDNKVIDRKIEFRGHKFSKKIYTPYYFKEDFFKEENIKYRYSDITFNEINNLFLENIRVQFVDKKKLMTYEQVTLVRTSKFKY